MPTAAAVAAAAATAKIQAMDAVASNAIVSHVVLFFCNGNVSFCDWVVPILKPKYCINTFM